MNINQETLEKGANLVEGLKAQVEKDGDLLALTHKVATEQQSQLEQKDQKIQELNQKLEEVQKSAGENQSEQPAEIDEDELRATVNKIAEDGLTDESLVESHVENAKKDPNHLVKMMDVQERAYRENKQASEESLSPVGRLDESSGSRQKKSNVPMEKQAEAQTSRQYEELDKQMGQYLNSYA